MSVNLGTTMGNEPETGMLQLDVALLTEVRKKVDQCGEGRAEAREYIGGRGRAWVAAA